MEVLRRVRFVWACLCLVYTFGVAGLAHVSGPSAPASPWAVTIASLVSFWGLALSFYGRRVVAGAAQFLFAGVLPAFYCIFSFGHVPAPVKAELLLGLAAICAAVVVVLWILAGISRRPRPRAD